MRIVTTWEGKALPLVGGTMTGDITMSDADIALGANTISFSDVVLVRDASGRLAIKNLAENSYLHLRLGELRIGSSISCLTSGVGLNTANIDDYVSILKARDNTNALVEVARLQGAADPYFQATLPMVLKPGTIPGTPVEGHQGYEALADALWFRDASATRWLPKTIRKTADQAVNNSETVVNCTDLALPVGISEVFAVFLFLKHTTVSATPDLKIAFTVPTNGVFTWITDPTAHPSVGVNTTSEVTIYSPTGEHNAPLWGVYVGGDTAGNLQLKFAQETATSEDTKILANSYLTATKLA